MLLQPEHLFAPGETV